jgi:multidrug efflux system membrane fusion protein
VWLFFLVILAGISGYAIWRVSRPAVRQSGQGGVGGGGRGGAGLGPVPVVVQTIARTSIPNYLKGLGNVSPFYTVTVKSRVDGQIIKVDFNEGDLVKQGQLLIEIDPRPYQVQLEIAQAALAHDQALLSNARVDLERYKQLLQTNAIPSQQLDTQVALVAQYEATIKQDQANIDSANLQLIYSKIISPTTGVVGLRLVDPGNIVHAADTSGMIVITQVQPIAVLFTIPEDNLPAVTKKLRAGEHLPVDAYSRDDSAKLASGKLMTLDNQIDSTTGTSKLKAVFDNNDFTLFPQQFVNMRLLVDTLTNQLVVPNVAIQTGQQGTFVYTVDDRSRVHLKTVQVGITTDTSADILSGLSEGDRVVVDGTDRLSEGTLVRILAAGEQNNPAPGNGKGGGGAGRRSGRGMAGTGGGGIAGAAQGAGPTEGSTSNASDGTSPDGHGGPGNNGGGGEGHHRVGSRGNGNTE